MKWFLCAFSVTSGIDCRGSIDIVIFQLRMYDDKYKYTYIFVTSVTSMLGS